MSIASSHIDTTFGTNQMNQIKEALVHLNLL